MVDPVCAFDYGHNLNALHYFSRFASAYWREVVAAPSYLLKTGAIEPDINAQPSFAFYYEKDIAIATKGSPYGDDMMIYSAYQRAGIDVANFFCYQEISSDDCILMPSVDFYSLRAFLLHCQIIGIYKAPLLMVRFIGVMENVFGEDGTSELFNLMRQHVIGGGRIRVAAETPRLAAKIASATGMDVFVVPYPMDEAVETPAPSEEIPFTVLFGGSARADKGFDRIGNIIDNIDALGGGGRCRFLIQSFPPASIVHNLEALRKLYARPDVELLEGVLTAEQIHSSFRRCHICVMPYDENVYKFRGSAILAEALRCSRLTLGQSGTAFAEQILYYGSGGICLDDKDFADQILLLSNIDRENLHSRALLARSFYVEETSRAHALWIGSSTDYLSRREEEMTL